MLRSSRLTVLCNNYHKNINKTKVHPKTIQKKSLIGLPRWPYEISISIKTTNQEISVTTSMKKVEKEVKKLEKEVKQTKAAVVSKKGHSRERQHENRRHDTREFKRTKDPMLRTAIMSAYFPSSQVGDPAFPKPNGNYDQTGYQAQDKTLLDMNFDAESVYWTGEVATQTNVACFFNVSTAPNMNHSYDFAYDRQFPDIQLTHKCRLVGMTITFEMVVGSLANTEGALTICVSPPAADKGELTGLVYRPEDMAIMHGSSVLTAADLASNPVTVVWSRVGPGCDMFKPSVSMSTSFNAETIRKISQGKGFTHNPSRVRSLTKPGIYPPGAVYDNYNPTIDCLVPMWHAKFTSGTIIRATVERYWDIMIVPQDTSVMNSITETKKLPEKTAEQITRIMHALPAVPAPTAQMPAAMIVNNIAKAVESGGSWIEENQDSLRTAAQVFGTTVKLGAKVASLLL